MEKMVQITERTIIMRQSDGFSPTHMTFPSLPVDPIASLDTKVFIGLGLLGVVLGALLIVELWPKY